KYGLNLIASGSMILGPTGSNFDASHDISKFTCVRQTPLPRQAIQQARAVGVSAARGVDDLRGDNGGDMRGAVTVVNDRAVCAVRDDDALQTTCDVFHAATGTLQDNARFILVHAQYGRQAQHL